MQKKPGFIKKLSTAIKAAWRPQSINDLDRWMDLVVSGGASAAGVNVGPENAFTVSALFSAIQQIAQTVASLPLDVYQRKNKSKKYLPQYPLNKLFGYKVNPIMSGYTYKELTMVNACFRGNSFWMIERDSRGRVAELWPIATTSVEIEVKGRKRNYLWKTPEGTKVILPEGNVHHVMGLTRDGVQGLDILTLAKESIGVSIAQEGFQGAYFGNGANIGGVLSHPSKLSEEAHKKLKESVRSKYQGFTNAHKIMILEEGMTYIPFELNLVDSQFLEARTFQIQEVARWLNMPPHKLKDLSRATFSNIEAEQVSWLQDTIRPWLVRHEQAVMTQLLTEGDFISGHFAEYNPDAILRATPTARFTAYQTGLANGWLNRDEVRSAENYNPMPGKGGKIYTVQGAMINLESIVSSQPKQIEPVGPAEPVEQKEPEEAVKDETDD